MHMQYIHTCSAPYTHAPPLTHMPHLLHQHGLHSLDVGQPGQQSPGLVTGVAPSGHWGRSQEIVAQRTSPPLQVLQGMMEGDTLSLKE